MDRISQVFPDAMHTIKDAMEHVFNVIIGKEDSEKVRKAENELNRFGTPRLDDHTVHVGTKRPRSKLPDIPFHLTDADIKIANERVTLSFYQHMTSHPNASLPSPLDLNLTTGRRYLLTLYCLYAWPRITIVL